MEMILLTLFHSPLNRRGFNTFCSTQRCHRNYRRGEGVQDQMETKWMREQCVCVLACACVCVCVCACACACVCVSGC